MAFPPPLHGVNLTVGAALRYAEIVAKCYRRLQPNAKRAQTSEQSGLGSGVARPTPWKADAFDA